MNLLKRAIQFASPGIKSRSSMADSAGDKPVFLKIYGERNTGTHFVQRLIRRNYQCRTVPGTLAEACPGYRESIEAKINSEIADPAKRLFIRQAKMDAYFRGNLWNTLGWKHAVPPFETILDRSDLDNILFVTVTKNPYAWILSLFRRPYEHLGINRPRNLADFITEPWPTVARDNAPALLPSPISLWNIKTAGYACLGEISRVIRCRYEDILTDPEKFLDSLSGNLTRTGSEFIVETDSAKGKDKGKKDLGYYRDYYLHERWRSELTSEHIELINRYLDMEVLNEAGYETVESDSIQQGG